MPRILPLTPALIPDAAVLIRNLRTAMNGKVVCTTKDMEAVLTRSLPHEAYRGFVAYGEGGGLQGYIGLNARFAIYANGGFFQVTELFVQPETRRSGVATALLKFVERRAKAEYGSAIEIGAPDADLHPDAYAFYRHHGYHVVGPRFSKSLS